MSDQRLRRPPAYQVYAADDLAGSSYYPLSAGERGVLDSMQRACWVDDAVPKDPRLLALVLRLQESDVRLFLTPGVLAHFEQEGSNAGLLRSRELTRQMANIKVVREQQREGGKQGARLTNSARRKQEKGQENQRTRLITPQLASRPAGTPATPELRRDERIRLEPNQKRSLGSDVPPVNPEHREWLDGYNDVEA